MNGTPCTRDQRIESHHYLCARAARKFVRDGVDRNDLEQVAAIGLIKASDRYDPSVGTPFEAFAWLYILGELMHYVRDHERMLRAPRRLRDLARRWAVAQGELRHALQSEPTDADVTVALGLSPEEERDVRRYRESEQMLSVDALGSRERSALSYTMERQVDRVAIARGLATLSPLEQTLIHEIYENDTPLVEVANKLGYSRRHMTRLHQSALKKLAPFACHRAV